jgi:hypothetical protein
MTLTRSRRRRHHESGYGRYVTGQKREETFPQSSAADSGKVGLRPRAATQRDVGISGAYATSSTTFDVHGVHGHAWFPLKDITFREDPKIKEES